MTALTLFAESTWVSPWVFHAMVAFEEKGLPYDLEVIDLPISPARRAEFERRGLLGKVPFLVHGEVGLTESLAISEYLAERFPTPGHPRLFPADLAERGRARQVMSFLRTSLFALRAERPTTSVFRPRVDGPAPLSPAAQADAAELVRIAERLVAPGATSMFGAWCIADADLALALQRLARNGDALPAHLADYARAVWERPSIRKFLAAGAR